jgi:inhibitor of cysteine peptidase
VVEKEIRKKTQVYGTVAILSAVVLVALIYTFGAAPVIFNPSISPIRTFASYAELKDFLVTSTKGFSYYAGGPLDTKFFTGRNLVIAPMPVPAMASQTYNAGSEQSYSTTNIQVTGVDEADIVKTDGNYIYVIANNSAYIIDANPQNAKVLAKIAFNNTYLAGMFLSQDSNKLAVLGSQYSDSIYSGGPLYSGGNNEISIYGIFANNVDTFINVYDISNKANPVLARNFTMSGSYFNSRMIGNYVYAVISQPAYAVNETVILPRVYSGDNAVDIAATKIFYSDVVNYNNYLGFTTFIGLNFADSAQEPTSKTIMVGGASNMYVSLNDIYVTYPSSDGEGTAIYRVHINEDNLTFEAQGKVPGNVLNQYSMDEYNGYFRLATTGWTKGAPFAQPQQNNVYVLNMSLAVVGKLENLATGENLHSARFMGDKCYLVTFIKTDPLFVIDLSQPDAPKKLGELHIPGYSDYLHPYDETHLIGVGKETVEASEGNFAWYQGLKLSLFDVSDVNEPKQMSNYTIGDRGTDSPVLSDPKAFLFDKSKNLLVIPINLAVIDKTAVAPSPNAYGTFVWQGVYVFRLTLNDGFVLEGNVTQMEINASLYPTFGSSDFYSMNSDHWISRALYIGNTLYTVSNAGVQLNSLENLALIAKVDLS